MPLNDAALAELLRSARTIAVVGLSPNPARPSHEVATGLQQAGYRIVPVRPGVASVLGERAWPTLEQAAAAGPIDVVNVFRRSEFIPDLIQACITIRPRLVFLQVGVAHPEAEASLEAAGIPVIANRCLLVDLHRLLGP
jgi:predicted CoA-binding protein